MGRERSTEQSIEKTNNGDPPMKHLCNKRSAIGPRLTAILILATVFGASARADIVTVTYDIYADTFQDSNFNPPVPPTSTIVLGTLTFAFDNSIPSTLNIVPNAVTGFDITSRLGAVKDYDETNSAVNAQLVSGIWRFTYGGLLNGPGAMSGGTDDFRVLWDVNPTDYQVIGVNDGFDFNTAVTFEPSYQSQNTIITLRGVPEPGTLVWVSSSSVLLLLRRRRSRVVRVRKRPVMDIFFRVRDG